MKSIVAHVLERELVGRAPVEDAEVRDGGNVIFWLLAAMLRIVMSSIMR